MEFEGSEEIVGDSLSSHSCGKESPPVISANKDQGTVCMKKPKQVLLY